jgi:hypothetical protein
MSLPIKTGFKQLIILETWFIYQRVHMADIDLYPEYAPEYRTKMTEEESQTIVNAYERAIKPLSKLRGKGLNRFFKDLKLPWGRAVKSIRKQKEEPSAYIAELRELQLWGERLVMGGNVQGNLTSLNGVYRHSNITVSDAAIYHGNYFSLVLSICGYPRPLSTLVRQMRPQTSSISQTDLAHALYL